VSDPTATFATPRIASGALFVDGDRILLVRKTYGNGWDIPGGYAEVGESPAAACQRELKEELGLHRDVQRLLAVDWAPLATEGDKILYVFDCVNSAPTRTASSSQTMSWTDGNGYQSSCCPTTSSHG
jgi:ADP-ribose pyrophosphatase YjhB (NUDIX family)